MFRMKTQKVLKLYSLKSFFACLLFTVVVANEAKCVEDEKLSVQLDIDVAAYPGLVDSVNRYYRAERAENWEITYSLRPANFIRLYPFARYREIMERDSRKGKLVSIHLIGAHQEIDKYISIPVVEIEIKFVDELSVDRIIMNNDGKSRTVTSSHVVENAFVTIWMKEKTGWKCVDCGSRVYLILNGRMIR